jgi:hypothetical protein
MHLALANVSRRGLVAAAATSALALTVLTPLPAARAVSPTTSASTVLTLTSKTTVGVPASLAPGWHTFILKEGTAQGKKDPRGLQVLQLAKGYTVAQLKKDGATVFGPKYTAAARKAYTRVLKNARFLGGLNLSPTYTATGDRFTVWLKPGTYWLDNQATNEGAPDSYTAVTVKGTAVGTKPKNLGTITSKEFAFKVVHAKAGKHLYALHDAGAQMHMYVMLRLNKGHSLAEIEQALRSDGPPPAWVHDAGFAGLLTGDQTMYTALNLSSKSDYLLVCFMPDVKTGAPHVALGMVRLFAVK